MEILILLAVCASGGWWLYSLLLGSGDKAADAVKEDPARGIAGIICGAVLILVFLWVLGTLGGG